MIEKTLEDISPRLKRVDCQTVYATALKTAKNNAPEAEVAFAFEREEGKRIKTYAVIVYEVVQHESN